MSDDQQSKDQNPSDSRGSPQAGLAAFWQELKRRKVMRVAITYAVVAWLIIQIASSTFGWFDIPKWAFRLVTLCVILGFPLAIILAWAFELTPDGIKTTKVAQEETDGTAVSKAHEKKRNWFSVLFAAAVPSFIFGTLALIFYFQTKPVQETQERLTNNPITQAIDKSIAVLPLANMSPDPENAFFADGVHEDILTKLSKVEALRVISRTSTLGYRNTTKKLKEIGEELGVRYLIEGSVRRAGDHVRVTVQLIDAPSDQHLWAESYDRGLDNIFEIQSEIAQIIASKLQAVLSPGEVAGIQQRPTDNVAAYDAFLKARELIRNRNSASRGYEKIALLEEAVRLDPEFTDAWAQLAVECIYWWDVGTARGDSELLEKTQNAFREASQREPDHVNVHFARAIIAARLERDFEQQVESLRKALAVDPNFEPALFHLAVRLRWQGSLVESQELLEKLLETDPFSNRANTFLMWTYVYQRSWDKARKLIQTNLRRNQDPRFQLELIYVRFLEDGDLTRYFEAVSKVPGYLESPRGKAWLAIRNQDYSTALNHLKEVQPADAWLYGSPHLKIDNPVELLEAILLTLLGDRSAASMKARTIKQWNEKLIEKGSITHPGPLTNLAIVNAIEGNREAMQENVVKARTMARESRYRYDYELSGELQIAMAYILLGDDNQAIETLEAASNMDSPIFLSRELDLWFIFDRLRGNPRFDKLLKD